MGMFILKIRLKFQQEQFVNKDIPDSLFGCMTYCIYYKKLYTAV